MSDYISEMSEMPENFQSFSAQPAAQSKILSWTDC